MLWRVGIATSRNAVFFHVTWRWNMKSLVTVAPMSRLKKQAARRCLLIQTMSLLHQRDRSERAKFISNICLIITSLIKEERIAWRIS